MFPDEGGPVYFNSTNPEWSNCKEEITKVMLRVGLSARNNTDIHANTYCHPIFFHFKQFCHLRERFFFSMQHNKSTYSLPVSNRFEETTCHEKPVAIGDILRAMAPPSIITSQLSAKDNHKTYATLEKRIATLEDLQEAAYGIRFDIRKCGSCKSTFPNALDWFATLSEEQQKSVSNHLQER